jgi:DNA-binding GntR family transcriptional regulator
MALHAAYPKDALERSDDAMMHQQTSILKRQVRLGTEIYELLLGQLMSLRLPPGSRITVDNLARELGVSQTPIREALGRLEMEGLVIKTHLVGYSAAPQLNRQQFEELYELRLLLEPAAARHAAQRMTNDELQELTNLARQMHAAAADDARISYNKFARLDAAFHDRIVVGGGNSLIRDTLARLHVHIHLFRLFYHSRVTAEAVDEHANILTALLARDGDGAADALERHIMRSRTRFIQIFNYE